MIIDKADEVIKKLFGSLVKKHQNNLEKSMTSSDFIFDIFHLLQ